jgi:hypothetical protein
MATAITRYRGDTQPIDVVVTELVLGAEVPLNVTGATFLLTVDPSKTPADASNNLFQLVGTITDAAFGAVSFYPTATDVDAVGKFFYDVQMTDGSGRKRTIVKDSFKLLQDITKV